MEAWTWLIAYLLGFALLQLVLYRYFQRGESTHDGDTETGHRRFEHRSASADVTNDTDAQKLRCQQCGSHNDRTYSYCRNCAETLR